MKRSYDFHRSELICAGKICVSLKQTKSCFCRERKPSEKAEKETEKLRIPVPRFQVSLNRRQINNHLHPRNHPYGNGHDKVLMISPITSLHLEGGGP